MFSGIAYADAKGVCGCLSVNTTPENALVKIMDIKPKFYQDMPLIPGSYHVEVSADGYVTKLVPVTLNAGKTTTLNISLKEKSIRPEDAHKYIGQVKTVCGTVASKKYAEDSRGKPTSLNLNKEWPYHIFTVVIWGSHRHKFGRPEEFYKDKRICVTGKISTYDGKPQIEIREKSQITVIE